MGKKIIIGLSVLSVGLLVAAIAAPLAIQAQNKAEIEKLEDATIDRVELTEAGTTFFEEIKTASGDKTGAGLVIAGNNAIDLEANLENWDTWFQAINQNGNVLLAPENQVVFDITDLTLKKNVENTAVEASLTLEWNETMELYAPSNTSIINVYNELAKPILTFVSNEDIGNAVEAAIPFATNLADLNAKIAALTPEAKTALQNAIIISSNEDPIETFVIEAFALAEPEEGAHWMKFTFTLKDGLTLDAESEASKELKVVLPTTDPNPTPEPTPDPTVK